MNEKRLIQILCEEFNLSRDELLSRTRRQPVALARQIGYYLLVEAGYTQIRAAWVFGRIDHSAVCHGRKLVRWRCFDKPEFRDRVEWIQRAAQNRLTLLDPWKAVLEEWRESLPQVIEGNDPFMAEYRRLHMEDGHAAE